VDRDTIIIGHIVLVIIVVVNFCCSDKTVMESVVDFFQDVVSEKRKNFLVDIV